MEGKELPHPESIVTRFALLCRNMYVIYFNNVIKALWRV